jgi:ribosomal protein L37AE/L43A
MKLKDAKIVKSILGEDIFEELKKSAIYKPETKTAVQPEEIRVALEIVPRSVLSFLFANLKHQDNNAVVDLDLPWAMNAKMHVNKLGADNYSGEITKEGKRLYEFQHRSLPSIGLILLSVFELYDIDMLNEIKEKPVEPAVQNRVERLQDLIDERLSMHNLIKDVVDKRITEREAISRLIKEKLSEHIASVSSAKEEIEEQKEDSMDNDNKKSKLRQFLENREKKRQEPVEMDKSEDIKCPDCKTVIHKKESNEIVPCICYGEHMTKPIKITKTEDGKIKIKFPKTFDIENIEMLLDAVKKQ